MDFGLSFQLQNEGQIKLEVSSSTVESLLTYLYTGELTLPFYVRRELSNLAGQLELTPLLNACDKLVQESEHFGGEENEEPVDQMEEFTESKINLKEIWGESDSESEDEADDTNELDAGGSGGKGRLSEGQDTSATSNTESDLDREDHKAVKSDQMKHLKEVKEKKEQCVETKRIFDDASDNVNRKLNEKVVIDLVNKDNVNRSEGRGKQTEHAIDEKTDSPVTPVAKRIRVSSDNRCPKSVENEGMFGLVTSDLTAGDTSFSANVEVMDTSEDLFASPTPKKDTSANTGANSKSFLDSTNVNDDSLCLSNREKDTNLCHSSTPCDVQMVSLRRPRPRVSNISSVISSESFNRNQFKSITGDSDITNQAINIGSQDIVSDFESKAISSDALDVSNTVTETGKSEGKDDTDSDNDLQITGDNFDLINSSQNQSPVFVRNMSSNSAAKQISKNKSRYLGIENVVSDSQCLRTKSQDKGLELDVETLDTDSADKRVADIGNNTAEEVVNDEEEEMQDLVDLSGDIVTTELESGQGCRVIRELQIGDKDSDVESQDSDGVLIIDTDTVNSDDNESDKDNHSGDGETGTLTEGRSDNEINAGDDSFMNAQAGNI